MTDQPLRLSVLADGSILLDGAPATMASLADALDAAAAAGRVVWYYRENPAGDPPPEALEALQLVTDRKLPIRLFTTPDFADSLAAQAFAKIRQRAAERRIVVLGPDGRSLSLPAMARESAPPAAVAAVEKLLPSTQPRNAAVIADTSWTHTPQPDLREAGRAIPFFGILMGFAAIGHTVWVFHGGESTFPEGCRAADILIVDDARLVGLPAGWEKLAAPIMRVPQILVFDRASQRFRKV